MKRPSALALTLFAAVAALLPAAGLASASAVAAGRVCFWTEIGQHGQAWCYAPPGYADAEGTVVHRRAVSFSSSADRTLYAISYNASGCLYRTIYAGDYSENWEWAGKFDGISDNNMGCEQG
ncbi:MAG: hypothetical protein LBV60_26855 [Streptomyces sp.]|jgi:hypothetical protein|nr:hypothetical protein [Streptomyces sp.]